MEIKPVYLWPGMPNPSPSNPAPCEQHRSDPGNRSFIEGGKLYCKETSVSKKCQELKYNLEK